VPGGNVVVPPGWPGAAGVLDNVGVPPVLPGVVVVPGGNVVVPPGWPGAAGVLDNVGVPLVLPGAAAIPGNDAGAFSGVGIRASDDDITNLGAFLVWP